jgi:hypothetical protein
MKDSFAPIPAAQAMLAASRKRTFDPQNAGDRLVPIADISSFERRIRQSRIPCHCAMT